MKRTFLPHFLLTFCCVLLCSGSVPFVQWRGVMIDVSRHYYPVQELYRQVDIMSNYGLNVLHLHLTDAAGWRLEIRKYPRLTQLGAWRTRPVWKDWWELRTYSDSIRGYGGYYTQEQMRQLVRYAQDKGVTIVPEIEFPGHSEAVCAAYPHIAFDHAELDMSNPETFRFMQDVLQEVAEIFPSAYIHCGGDESATQKDAYIPSIRKLNGIVRRLGRKMIMWDEALTDDLADSTIVIMVWRDAQYGARAAELGHEVIMCPSTYCYLDSYQDAPATQPETMGGYRPIDRVLEVRNVLPKERLLGLQANVFTEYVPTVQLLEYQLWPRALAVAEIGMRCNRPLQRFRKWAMHVADSLRAAGVNAFDLRNEQGQRPQALRKTGHLARGCSVTFGNGCRYSSIYPASGDNALTDGMQGTWNNNDGRWQGFCCNMDITIDLGRERTVSQVTLPFMQITGPGIFLPLAVTVGFDNGAESPMHQALDGCAPNAVAAVAGTTPYAIAAYSYTGKTRTRYIRIRAQRIARGGWLFADEVIVR